MMNSSAFHRYPNQNVHLILQLAFSRSFLQLLNSNSELRVTSNGYLLTGYIPLCIAFLTLAGMLLGPNTPYQNEHLMSAFIDSISSTEAALLKECLKMKGSSFSVWTISFTVKNVCYTLFYCYVYSCTIHHFDKKLPSCFVGHWHATLEGKITFQQDVVEDLL